MKTKAKSRSVVLALTAIVFFLFLISSTASAVGSSSTKETYAYISNHESDTISVVNLTTNTVVATVNVGNCPVETMINPAGTKVYVTNYHSNTVSVIDAATNNVTAMVNVGLNPYGITVSPDGTKVYVTNCGANTVSIIDVATNNVTATVKVGTYPYGITLSPDETKVYVVNEGTNNVSVIDVATNNVTATVKVGTYPHGIALNPTGTKAYVTNSYSDTVSIIDTANNNVTATVDVGPYPVGIKINSAGTKIYVAHDGSNIFSIIDTDTNTVILNVNFGADPFSMGKYIDLLPAQSLYHVKRNPHYIISKSVINPDASGDCIVNSPGDEIPYRIVVKNDGNVDLTGVSVKDPMISLTGPIGDANNYGVLNPGETWVYNGIYKLTQDDINNGNGKIDNTATVSSNELPEESSNVIQPIEQKADLSIQKSIIGIDEAGDFLINQPGDVINYKIAVENNGNVDLHSVYVTDSLINDLSGPTGDSVDPGVLKPGETWIYKGDYTVTQADISSNGDGSGFITNTATVSCKEHSSESSTIEVPIVTATNTQNDINAGSDNTSANRSNSNPQTIDATQTTSSNGEESSGGSGGSIGIATIVGSSRNGSTGAAAIVTPSENVTQSPILNNGTTPANVEQTPEQQGTSTPAKQNTKTPGFEIISGITALLGAVYLYRRK